MVQIKTARTVLDLVTLSRGQASVTSFHFYSFPLTTSSLGKDAQINLHAVVTLSCVVLSPVPARARAARGRLGSVRGARSCRS